jgi:hypothetical protein
MAAPINPASTKVFGKDKWVFVVTIANISSPTAAECTAGTTLDVSCYLFDDQFDRPSKNTNTVTKSRRVCDTALYSQIGTTTYEGGNMAYAVQPQAAALSDGKKAWEKFPAGTVGYLVRRMGIDVATDLAVGQFVDVYPVELGPSMPTSIGEGEAAEAGAMCTFAITSAPAFIKALA